MDWPATRLAIALADEGVIAGLVRRPNLDTVANVWASGRVDIRNGTILISQRIRPRVRTREFRQKPGQVARDLDTSEVLFRATRRTVAGTSRSVVAPSEHHPALAKPTGGAPIAIVPGARVPSPR